MRVTGTKQTIEQLEKKLIQKRNEHQEQLNTLNRIIDPSQHEYFDTIEDAKIDPHFARFYLVKQLACKQFYTEVLTYFEDNIEALKNLVKKLSLRFRNEWDLNAVKTEPNSVYKNAYDMEFDREFIVCLLLFKRDVMNIADERTAQEQAEEAVKKFRESQIKMNL